MREISTHTILSDITYVYIKNAAYFNRATVALKTLLIIPRVRCIMAVMQIKLIITLLANPIPDRDLIVSRVILVMVYENGSHENKREGEEKRN